MNNQLKKYIICPDCLSTTTLKFDGSLFYSKCPLNHSRHSEKINIFLSEKVKNGEFECEKHKKDYIQFCKICNKNICPDCFEDHEAHENDLVFFPKIRIKKKQYEKYSEELKSMQMHKNKIDKSFNKIQKLKEMINELNNYINELYDEYNLFINKFQNQYNFNKIIFESYDINKLNYNTILNIKNFNFNEDKIHQFKNNSINKENMINNIIHNINPIAFDNSLNTFISLNYCEKWGISEAIREILQNQIDEIITRIGGKKELFVEDTGEEIILFDFFTSSEIKTKLNFIFKKVNDNKIYGEIKYNKDLKQIIISNIGKMEAGDLLFGCAKTIENKKDIIGRFGEGMKLAALTFCRLDKKFIIKSNDKIWTFFLRKDDRFKKNNEIQNCLFWKEEINLEYNMNNLDDNVEIIISEINPEEWLKETDKYLWLNRRQACKIKAYSNDFFSKEIIGEIMLGNYFKRKLYVKDCYIETTSDSSNLSLFFGFNLDLELDRDRKCVIDIYERNKKICKIISYILKNFETIKKSLQPNDTILLDKFLEGVYYCLQNDYQFIYYLNNEVEIGGVNLLWNYMEKINDSNKGKYPVNNINYINTFIYEKNLPKDFYPCFQVSFPLSQVLGKNKNFIDIESKYNTYLKNVEIEENIPNEYLNALDEIIAIIKKLYSSKTELHGIKFKKFKNESKDICYKDKVIIKRKNKIILFFSNKLLQENPDKNWKCFILGKCSEMLEIKTSKIIYFSNIIN